MKKLRKSRTYNSKQKRTWKDETETQGCRSHTDKREIREEQRQPIRYSEL
jgi:hypothetical protein